MNFNTQQPSIGTQAMPQYYQQTPQLFPTPQGNVYFINNSLEIANIPMGTGFSAALCLSEKLLYLKTLQNGNPMLLVYNLEPYKNNEENNENDTNIGIIKNNSIKIPVSITVSQYLNDTIEPYNEQENE